MQQKMGQVTLILILLLTSVQVKQVWLLSIGFYAHRCPPAEIIVTRILGLAARRDPSLPAAMLRLLYHDCFVGGCDASVLLDSAYGYPPPEKMARPNRNLRGVELVDLIKGVLEVVCPSTVSCADIIALAARDAVTLAGGPHWEVPTGRRDTRLSSALLTEISLPTPESSLAELRRRFLQHGMSEAELIILSGAHTIGFARCSTIWDRLYNYPNEMGRDPTMDGTYLARLKKACPRSNRNSRKMIPLDPTSPFRFDNMYYRNLERGLGLLNSDQVLHDRMIFELASNSTLWEDMFSQAMIHMSEINVKEGFRGEIRRHCRRRN